MNYIEFYNFLDGKNLCNIFANLIVKEINNKLPDAKTDISVINVRNFFIVKGTTTYNEVINLAELFQNYLKKYDTELSNKVRVIDSILYNKVVDQEPLNLKEVFIKSQEKKYQSLQQKLNKYTEEKVYFNFKLQERTNHVYYDCSSEQLSTVITILEEQFPEYVLVKSDFSQEIYISDKVYGLSNNNRLYHFLLWSIKNHIFELGISKKLDVSLYSDVNINEMNNLTVNFVLHNDNHIVKTEWLESLVLDVFPFDVESLNTKFGDIEDLEELIMVTDESYQFKQLSYLNDFILL
jgi:frataxin-like iron-binding protein CyaY